VTELKISGEATPASLLSSRGRTFCPDLGTRPVSATRADALDRRARGRVALRSLATRERDVYYYQLGELYQKESDAEKLRGKLQCVKIESSCGNTWRPNKCSQPESRTLLKKTKCSHSWTRVSPRLWEHPAPPSPAVGTPTAGPSSRAGLESSCGNTRYRDITSLSLSLSAQSGVSALLSLALRGRCALLSLALGSLLRGRCAVLSLGRAGRLSLAEAGCWAGH